MQITDRRFYTTVDEKIRWQTFGAQTEYRSRDFSAESQGEQLASVRANVNWIKTTWRLIKSRLPSAVKVTVNIVRTGSSSAYPSLDLSQTQCTLIKRLDQPREACTILRSSHPSGTLPQFHIVSLRRCVLLLLDRIYLREIRARRVVGLQPAPNTVSRYVVSSPGDTTQPHVLLFAAFSSDSVCPRSIALICLHAFGKYLSPLRHFSLSFVVVLFCPLCNERREA